VIPSKDYYWENRTEIVLEIAVYEGMAVPTLLGQRAGLFTAICEQKQQR
jgi:hypothetical protein